MVDRDFLGELVTAKGFDPKWRRWIRGCISTENYSIIIDREPRGKIIDSRGHCHSDPLSLFLFTIVANF